MIKPARQEINAQSVNLESDGHLKTEDQADALTVVRDYLGEKADAYPYLEEDVAAVTGYRAQQILAGIASIDVLGKKSPKVAIQGLLTREKDVEREDLGRYVFMALAPRKRSAAATYVISGRTRCCSRCGSPTCTAFGCLGGGGVLCP